jgi:hypothetical protein
MLRRMWRWGIAVFACLALVLPSAAQASPRSELAHDKRVLKHAIDRFRRESAGKPSVHALAPACEHLATGLNVFVATVENQEWPERAEVAVDELEGATDGFEARLLELPAGQVHSVSRWESRLTRSGDAFAAAATRMVSLVRGD